MTKREIFFIVIVIILGLSGSAIYDEVKSGKDFFNIDLDWDFKGPSHTFVTEEIFDVSDIGLLSIENSYGFITVAPGNEHTIKLKLEKLVYLEKEEDAKAFANRIMPKFSASGSEYKLGTNRDLFKDEKTSFKTNLIMEIPPSLQLNIVNRHGDVTLDRLKGGIELATEFADIKLQNTEKKVIISNRHGDIEISGSGSEVEIKNEHGDVKLSDIMGDTIVDTKHSSVSAEDMKGSVQIVTSHGDVLLRNVTGEASVNAPHTEVTAENLEGFLTVLNSHRDIIVSGVKKGAKIESKHGDVTVTDAEGSLDITASYESVTLENIRGVCSVDSERCGVGIKGQFEGGRIRASHNDVRIAELSGPLSVSNNHGGVAIDVIFDPEKLDVETEYGNISIGISDPDSFTVKASADFGEITYPGNFPYLSEKKDNALVVTGGSGKNVLDLSASHGNIIIQEANPAI